MYKKKYESVTSRLYTQRVPRIIIAADNNTFIIRFRVIIGSLVSLGFCLSTSLSTGSTPRLINEQIKK